MTNELEKTDAGRESSLPAPFDPETLKLRLAYFGYTAVPSAILLEIMTQGQLGDSVAVAALLGGAACYWGPHLHKVIGPGLRAAGQVWDYLNRNNSGKTRHHLMNKHWWLYGEVEAPYAEQDDERRDENQDQEAETQQSGRPDGYITLAPDLSIPVDDLASKAIFIAGIRRSGKTTLGTRLAEELSQYYLPMLIPDLEGDWLSAAEVFPMGKIAAHPDAQGQYSDLPFEPTTVENADVVGFNILDEGMQLVLDMASYDTVDEACKVVIGIIRGMFDWANQYPKKRVPCHIFLDEAQRFLPQQLSDSIIQSPTVLQDLLKAYMDITAVGGKRGFAPVILSQRFAQVNNKIVAQSEIFFLLRQTMDNDLKRCMEYAKKSVVTTEQIAAFRKGEGVYIAATGEQLVTRFLPRQSDGKRSHTPTVEAAQRYKQARQQKKQVASDDAVDTSNIRQFRPAPERIDGKKNARYVPPVTGNEEPDFERDFEIEDPLRSARYVDDKAASGEDGRAQNDDVSLPPGWDQKKLDMLPGFYKVLNNLDKALIALDLSANQRNRDFARNQLKDQGLWKEAK